MATRPSRKKGRPRRSARADSAAPPAGSSGGGAPGSEDLDAPEGIRIRYEDRDVLVLERTAAASATALRRAIGQRAGEAGRGARRGAWPVSTLESGVTGLVLLARSPAARRGLEKPGGARIRYVGAATRTGPPASPRGGAPGAKEPVELATEGDWRQIAFERDRPHRDLVGWLTRRGYHVLREAGPPERLLLHGSEVRFAHPVTGKELRFESMAPSDLSEPRRAAHRAVSGVRRRAPSSATPSASPAEASPAERPTPSASTPAARVRTPPQVHTDWDEVAAWLDHLLEEREHDHYRDVILPGVLRLLDVAPGMRVLDVACGQGILCRALAERGIQTVGVEASPRLVRRARERSAERMPRPEFQVGDARALGALDLGRFDAAACILALTNIDPIEPVLAGCADRLDPHGRFVAVIPHPAFRIPRRSHWHWDRDADGASHSSRSIDAYLSPMQIPIVANPGEVARGERPIETQTFHRPLEHYVRALAKVGLWVDALEEWPSARTSTSGPRASEENRMRREIPLFLAVRARRIEARGPARDG